MNSGIYCIINSKNGKRYVGQAVNIARRINQHFLALSSGKHRCHHLQSAFSRYGEASFYHETLEVCSTDDLTKREQFWMDYYRKEGLYNTAPAAGSNLGIVFTEEHNKKISMALTGKKHPTDVIAKRAEANRGKKRTPEQCAAMVGRKHTEDARRKISEASRGKKKSPQHCEGISAAQKGRKQSPELVEKRVAPLRGKKRPPHVIEAVSVARRGKKATAETREKLSASHMGQIPWNKGKKGVSPETHFKMSLSASRRYADPTREGAAL